MAIGWACFRNYVEHAEEIGGDVTDYPRFFIMPHSSHSYSDEVGNNWIKLMDDNEHIDHEVELVIKLGDDLLPESMCIGCDSTNRTGKGLLRKRGGHGLKENHSEAQQFWALGPIGILGF